MKDLTTNELNCPEKKLKNFPGNFRFSFSTCSEHFKGVGLTEDSSEADSKCQTLFIASYKILRSGALLRHSAKVIH